MRDHLTARRDAASVTERTEDRHETGMTVEEPCLVHERHGRGDAHPVAQLDQLRHLAMAQHPVGDHSDTAAATRQQWQPVDQLGVVHGEAVERGEVAQEERARGVEQGVVPAALELPHQQQCRTGLPAPQPRLAVTCGVRHRALEQPVDHLVGHPAEPLAGSCAVEVEGSEAYARQTVVDRGSGPAVDQGAGTVERGRRGLELSEDAQRQGHAGHAVTETGTAPVALAGARAQPRRVRFRNLHAALCQ